MIIYGWKSAHLKTNQPQSLVCPSCETKGSTLVSAYSKHAHIFWIPLFPFGKTGASQCQHCQVAFDKKEMPETVRAEYDQLNSEVSTPIWQFAGLAIIAVLIGVGVISSNASDQENLDLIAAPLVDDVYEYKTEDKNYSTMKVIEVLEDSIYVKYNDYVISKKSAVHEIDIEENYNDSVYYGFPKEVILSKYESNEIYDVER